MVRPLLNLCKLLAANFIKDVVFVGEAVRLFPRFFGPGRTLDEWHPCFAQRLLLEIPVSSSPYALRLQIMERYNPKNILITGGGGFIASHVAIRLVKNYGQVRVGSMPKLAPCCKPLQAPSHCMAGVQREHA